MLITRLLLLLLFSLIITNCSNSNNDYLKLIDSRELNELITICNSVDSLIINKTGESDTTEAYINFLADYNDYCTNTSLANEIHNVLVSIQNYSVFSNIWKITWVIDVETYELELWLSINISDGKYWIDLAKKSNNLSHILNMVYQESQKSNVSIAFDILLDNKFDLSLNEDIDHVLLVLLIITRVVNSY